MLTGKLADLHEDSEGTRNSGWVLQTEMSKAAPKLFNKNNTLKAESCVHDLFNLKNKDRKVFKAHNPLPWVVYRQLCHSMAGCGIGAEENLNILLAENNRDNHAAYQQLHDDYANFVKSKPKLPNSTGKNRSNLLIEAAHGKPQDQTLDQSSGVTGKSVVAQNKELQDEVARLRSELDVIKKMMANNHGKVLHLAKTFGSSMRSLTGRYDRYRAVTDGRLLELEDASSGLVSLGGLSGHDDKHGENNLTSSEGHRLTYENLNASQSLTGDLSGVKPWLNVISNDTVQDQGSLAGNHEPSTSSFDATSNDTVQDQGSLTGNHEPTMSIQNATFEPESSSVDENNGHRSTT